MGRQLLVATTNAGKLKEVALALSSVPGLDVISLRDVAAMPTLPEDELTFRGNAVLKAIEYSRAASILALADDSGLCVDALSGEPGVHSARYGGPRLDDSGRSRKLLATMAGLPDPDRGAHFTCALALADRGRVVGVFDGIVRGRILTAPRGKNGFGYDPVFLYEPASRSFAEMSAEEKSAVSHRGRALAKLRDFLATHPEIFRE